MEEYHKHKWIIDFNRYVPKGTVVKIKSGVSAGKKAIIKDYTFQYNGQNFLNYLAEIEGKKGLFALYHDNIEVIHPAE